MSATWSRNKVMGGHRMVKTGQQTSRARLAEFRFDNPDTNLGLEALTLARLRRRLSPEARTALHRSDFHQLFVTTTGETSAVVDFEPISCRRGAALHVRPHQVLSLPSTRTRDSHAIAILFTPHFPQRLPLVESLLGPSGPNLLEVAPSAADALAAAATSLMSTYTEALAGNLSNPAASPLLQQMLGVVLLRLLASSDTGTDSDRPTASATVRLLHLELERSFTATRSASVYAHRLGYSTRTLNRACLDVTGHTAKEVIDARVVLEAKRLLAHTNTSASGIARQLGFTEATNFAKFFSRETEMTPGAFRAANQTISYRPPQD